MHAMNISRLINFLLIVAGGSVAIYAKAEMEQNQYVLLAGIMLLMIGVYRVSKQIPSKNDNGSTPDNEQEP